MLWGFKLFFVFGLEVKKLVELFRILYIFWFDFFLSLYFISSIIGFVFLLGCLFICVFLLIIGLFSECVFCLCFIEEMFEENDIFFFVLLFVGIVVFWILMWVLLSRLRVFEEVK